MKKQFQFAVLSAIALIGSGLASCTSTDEIAEVNPNYNPEKKEVTADFVFNVSTGNTATTRMTQANTQATTDQVFRGIDNATLLSFKLGTDGKNVATASTANKQFSLGTVIGEAGIDPDGGGSTTPKSRRVIELALPTETNCLMFWGKAIKNDDDYKQGKTQWTMSNNLANQEFSLVSIVPDDANDVHGLTAFNQYENLIATILTKIIQTSVTYNVTYPAGSTATQDQYTGTLAWSDFVEEVSGTLRTKTSTNGATDPICNNLGEILGNAYVLFNTIGTNEQRAGSGDAVARMIDDLYASILSVCNSIPTSKDEAIAQAVGVAIKGNIEKFFTVPTASSPSPSAFKDITDSSIKSTMLSDAGISTADLVTEDLNSFPTNFHLPAGSTILVVNKDNDGKRFYSYKGNESTNLSGGTSTFNPQYYMYPPELCYFGNSPIRVTNDTHVTSDYPDGTSSWAADASWTSWTKNGHVLSSTRSVAMQNNINYGTSLLKTTIRYNVGTLKDNNAAIQRARSSATEDDNLIDVTTAGQFELIGILIGGQEQTMGWNYIAKDGDEATFNRMVYDRDLPSKDIPAYTSSEPKSEPCFTTVWDNWDQALLGSKQRDVYIALEFTNKTGRDFWGKNNLIRKGGVFYIVGKLDPDAVSDATLDALQKTRDDYTSDKSLGVPWPSTASATTTLPPHALPPYNETDGSTIQQRRVFIQDYMTTAHFVIGENSLKYAVVAVPDLRSAQISLGLSVDMEWSAGLTFDGVILGQ